MDVISISWGFDNVKQKIAYALEQAHKKSIVIVAAAANHGMRGPIAFPARFKECVICIGAANGDGITSSYCADDPVLEKYTALGEAVRGASIANIPRNSFFSTYIHRGFLFKDDTVLKSGTSTAAPIAAGIAALFIEYTRQPQNQCKDAGSHSNMLKLFSAMSKDFDRTYRFLVPWQLLNENTDDSRRKIQNALEARNITFYACS